MHELVLRKRTNKKQRFTKSQLIPNEMKENSAWLPARVLKNTVVYTTEICLFRYISMYCIPDKWCNMVAEAGGTISGRQYQRDIIITISKTYLLILELLRYQEL